MGGFRLGNDFVSRKQELIKLAIFSFLIAYLWRGSTLLYGLAAREHYLVWYNTLGIDDKSSRSAIDPLFKYIQKEVIDREADNSSISELRRKLKMKWGLVFSGKTHRVLFHWGFNQDIFRYRPLIDEINRQWHRNPNFMKEKFKQQSREKDFNAFLESEKLLVLNCINNERNRRNREIIKRTTRITGIPLSSPARGFATLLWDIHILADFSTPENYGLPKPWDVRRDLVFYGLERMFDRKNIRNLCERLAEAQDNPSKMLALLQANLPSLLQQRYGRTLKAKGIVIGSI